LLSLKRLIRLPNQSTLELAQVNMPVECSRKAQ